MNFRMLARLALCVIVLFGMPAVVFGAPGPFERNWDWVDNKRDLTFCIEPNTPPLIADAAGFAASNLSNAGFQWTLTDMGNCPANWDLRKPAKGQAHIRVRVADLGAVVRPAGPHPESVPDYDQGEDYKPSPDKVPAPGRHPVFRQPPLAYFQPGPYMFKEVRQNLGGRGSLQLAGAPGADG